VCRWSIYAIALSADGATLAGCAGDGTVQLWNHRTGRRLRTVGAKGERMGAMAFSPDGGRADAWDAATGRKINTTAGEGGDIHVSVRFCRDGKTVALGRPGKVLLWNPHTDTPARTVKIPDAINPTKRINFNAEPGNGPIFTGRAVPSPDCTLAASVTESGAIALWHLRSRALLGRLAGSRVQNLMCGGVDAVVFSPDGRLVAVGNRTGKVEIWPLGRLARAAAAPAATAPATEKAEADAGAPTAAALRELEDLWAKLGSSDRGEAGKAVEAMAAMGDKAIAFLRSRLLPDAKTDERVKRLIAELDDDRYAVRAKAQKAIEGIGRPALPAVSGALEEQGLSEETRLRLKELVAKLTIAKPEEPQTRRLVRGVLVLARIKAQPAGDILRRLAIGPSKDVVVASVREAIKPWARQEFLAASAFLCDEGGSRAQASKRFAAMANRYPEHRNAPVAGELAGLLAQMAKEDARFQEPKDPRRGGRPAALCRPYGACAREGDPGDPATGGISASLRPYGLGYNSAALRAEQTAPALVSYNGDVTRAPGGSGVSMPVHGHSPEGCRPGLVGRVWAPPRIPPPPPRPVNGAGRGRRSGRECARYHHLKVVANRSRQLDHEQPNAVEGGPDTRRCVIQRGLTPPADRSLLLRSRTTHAGHAPLSHGGNPALRGAQASVSRARPASGTRCRSSRPCRWRP